MKDIDILIGSTIVSHEPVDPQDLTINVVGGKTYVIMVDDERCGGNDSHAWIDSVSLSEVIGHEITDAYHEDKSSYGVRLVLKAGDRCGVIEIIHEHNGYYGFSYEVVEEKVRAT